MGQFIPSIVNEELESSHKMVTQVIDSGHGCAIKRIHVPAVQPVYSRVHLELPGFIRKCKIARMPRYVALYTIYGFKKLSPPPIL